LVGLQQNLLKEPEPEPSQRGPKTHILLGYGAAVRRDMTRHSRTEKINISLLRSAPDKNGRG